jgi:hypothetical protein
MAMPSRISVHLGIWNSKGFSGLPCVGWTVTLLARS